MFFKLSIFFSFKINISSYESIILLIFIEVLPKNKGDNLKKFQNVTDKTQNILNITKSAVDKIFKGKKPTKEAKALVNIKKEDVKTKTTNNKLLIGGGIGLLALLFLMKKK